MIHEIFYFLLDIGAYGEAAFEELDEIFYILQPNCIF